MSMVAMTPEDSLNRKLDALWQEYRLACPDPEPSPNFMPNLWRRIEAGRGVVFGIPYFARRFATVAAAICTFLALLLLTPYPQSSPVYLMTYVDALSEEHELIAYSEIDNNQFVGDQSIQ
jgi:hypothetical protein